MGDPKRKKILASFLIMEATWLLLFIATVKRTPVLKWTSPRIVMKNEREKKMKGQSVHGVRHLYIYVF